MKNKNLKELDLSHASDLTKEALDTITDHLQDLIKLDISYTNIGKDDYTELLKVRSMPNLKILNCNPYGHAPTSQNQRNLEELKKLLPHLSINETSLYRRGLGIADPKGVTDCDDRLWDICIKCSNISNKPELWGYIKDLNELKELNEALMDEI